MGFYGAGLILMSLGLLAQAAIPPPESSGIAEIMKGLPRGNTSASPCVGDWLDADELGCFKFLVTETRLTWLEAHQKCELIGGYLAEPSNAGQAEFLHDVAVIYESTYGISNWWIGLSDMGYEGNWKWFHGCEALTESFWGASFPNTTVGNTDDCGVMVVEPDLWRWQDTNCLTTITVDQKNVAPICQHDRGCPDGWEQFDRHCYLVVLTGATWANAEADCKTKGGHLASVHSVEENDFIHLLYSSNWLWLGATDAVKEGTWVWTDGTALDYTKWTSGEPDGSYNCLGLNSNGLWYDNPACTSSVPYACKL